ncbi:MAG: hypothetical protein AAFN10_06635, partial [Bacteroidota bacterium]
LYNRISFFESNFLRIEGFHHQVKTLPMWRYSDNEAIREQIDHSLQKEEELSLFMRLWKRNVGFFTLIISFFLMMETLNPEEVRLKKGDAIVQNIDWDPWIDHNYYRWDYVTVAATGKRMGYFNYQPLLVPDYPEKNDPNLISPPPNWKLFYPQTSVMSLSRYCGCFPCVD